MSAIQARVMIFLLVLTLVFSAATFAQGYEVSALLAQKVTNTPNAEILAEATPVVVRGTVLKQDGSTLLDVSLWLKRDTGAGFIVIAAKPLNADGSFAFYISPVQATYQLQIDLPYGYEMIGANMVQFTLASNKFWEFRARAVTPTVTMTKTMIPTGTATGTPTQTATPLPPTATATATPRPDNGATLDIPPAARWMIAYAVYDSYREQEKVDPYDDFRDTSFWTWSQDEHQLGLPFTKPVYVTIQGVTYIGVGFLCEVLVMVEGDDAKYAVLDYDGRQVSRP